MKLKTFVCYTRDAIRLDNGAHIVAKMWIQKAIKHPDALRKTLGAKKGKPIPAAKLQKAAHSDNPKTAKRANLAITLKGLSHPGPKAK